MEDLVNILLLSEEDNEKQNTRDLKNWRSKVFLFDILVIIKKLSESLSCPFFYIMLDIALTAAIIIYQFFRRVFLSL